MKRKPANADSAMKVEILTVGNELLAGRLDENAAFLARTLDEAGARVTAITSVGDDVEALAAALAACRGRVGVVVVTGGLGVTPDDVTRAALARAAGVPLVRDDATLAALRAFYRRWERPMPELVAEQALVPAGARLLPNPVGQAPGLVVEAGETRYYAMPGVPAEMRAITTGSVLPEIMRLGGLVSRVSETLCLFGISESEVAERITPLVAATRKGGRAASGAVSPSDVDVSYLPTGNHLRLVLTARGARRAASSRAVRTLADRIARELGEAVYARGAHPVELEEHVGSRLRATRRTLAVAESLTGGRIGQLLTSVPGSSAYVDRVLVTYSNRSKVAELGVPWSLIRRHGAVSAEVAEAMARGVRRAARTHVGLATTGIAGPTGATRDKPVGLVYIAVSLGRRLRVERHVFPGARNRVQKRAALTALNALRLELDHA